MKCLMRMYAKENKGVLFYETILSFRQQRHTYIEAVPVPAAQFADCPAYFRVSGRRRRRLSVQSGRPPSHSRSAAEPLRTRRVERPFGIIANADVHS